MMEDMRVAEQISIMEQWNSPHPGRWRMESPMVGQAYGMTIELFKRKKEFGEKPATAARYARDSIEQFYDLEAGSEF